EAHRALVALGEAAAAAGVGLLRRLGAQLLLFFLALLFVLHAEPLVDRLHLVLDLVELERPRQLLLLLDRLGHFSLRVDLAERRTLPLVEDALVVLLRQADMDQRLVRRDPLGRRLRRRLGPGARLLQTAPRV